MIACEMPATIARRRDTRVGDRLMWQARLRLARQAGMPRPMARAGLALLSALLLALGLAASAPAAAAQADPPDTSQSVDGSRVGWIYDDIKAALEAGKADGKPVVVLASPENCGWCRKLERQALRCPIFNTLAGQAHFALDRHPGELEDQVDIANYPAIALFSVKGDNVAGQLTLIGYLEEPPLMQELAKAGLRSPGPNPLGATPTGLAPDQPRSCLPSPAPAAAGWTFGRSPLLLVLIGAAICGMLLLRRRRATPPG